MTEQENSHEELEAFRENLKEQLEMALIVIGTGQDSEFPVDPFTLGMGEIESQLSPSLLTVLRADLYEALKISTTDKPEPVNSYEVHDPNPDNESIVYVFAGEFENPYTEEASPIYLHEAVHAPGSIEGLNWLVSDSPGVSPSFESSRPNQQ